MRKLNENWDILNSCIKANNRELKGEFAPMAVLCARNEAEMRKICLCLKADKILFNIVGFPAIPKNEFRIRFCLSAAHTRVEMDCLVRSLNRSMH
ncbi:hypothetical protein KAR91_28030 [Candidatus Pacearchaeota archaeon]|nr:hypothetical protein [Candidatus Pacearchaeota archaeon]